MTPRPGLALAIAAGLLAAAHGSAAAGGVFSDWAAVFVAGDWHAHNGQPTETFDNARRDAATAFVAAGFEAANIRQFSVRPHRYTAVNPGASTLPEISRGLDAAAAKAPGGCLVYFTSHGAPEGILLGDRLITPLGMAAMITRSCGARPTVVVLSACFSGVFLPALAGPNRLVLTAARRDRSSFGCTESDKYPYFDACLLESLPAASDFADLGRRARQCVDRRETEEGLEPASEPQIQAGGEIRAALPLYAFEKSAVPRP